MAFKNWPEICKVEDHYVRLAIAFVDPNSDLESRLLMGFSQCFSATETQGPIPLSVLRAYADEKALREEGHSANGMLASYGVCKHFNLPCIEFATAMDTVDHPRPPFLPSSISDKAQVGDVVAVRGKLCVVLENNQNSGVKLMTLVPAECVDINS